MQIKATAKFDEDMDRVMKQQHSIAASIRRIDGKRTDGRAYSGKSRLASAFDHRKKKPDSSWLCKSA